MSSEIHSEIVVERFLVALGGHDRENLEATIKQFGCRDQAVWRPESSTFGDALGGRDQASLEAVIARVSRCTWRR